MRFVALVIGLTFPFLASAQLSGTKLIPDTFATVQLAIAYLNAEGVGPGGVTFKVAAGHTETFTFNAAGFITATGTAADPIVFEKNGTGANPLITGSSTGSSLTVDGIIVLRGADHITFSEIDLRDNPSATTNSQRAEFGYALLKKSDVAPYDGCNNVTIKNCNVTLSLSNPNSIGIYLANHAYSSSMTAHPPQVASDRSAFNKFYSNTILNAHTGIKLSGSSTITDSLKDHSNDVGGNSPATGNTITNFGGQATDAFGIYSSYQPDVNIQYNIINNNGPGGLVSGGTIYGIYNYSQSGKSATISNNAIRISKGNNNQTAYGIFAREIIPISSTFLKVTNNTLENWTSAGGTGGVHFISILGEETPVTVSGNQIANNNFIMSGSVIGISASSSTSSLVTANTILNIHASSGSLLGMSIYGGRDTISGNTITNLSAGLTVNGLMLSNGITNTIQVVEGNSISALTGSYAKGIEVNNIVFLQLFRNQVYDLEATSANGTCTGIEVYVKGHQRIHNNFISDLRAPISTQSNAVIGISIPGNSTNATDLINLIHNTVYLDASSSVAGFGSSAVYVNPINTKFSFRNNIFVNLSTPVAPGYTAAIRVGSYPVSPDYHQNSNRNVLFAGTPSADRVIYSFGETKYITLADYKAFVAPRDAESVTEQPAFLNITTKPYNLHLDPAIASLTWNLGRPVGDTTVFGRFFPAISHDIDNELRSSTPDAGADEIPGTVPVILSRFIGERYNKTNRLYWQTMQESNSLGFDLERSGNGTTFYRLSFVPSRSPNGNSVAPLDYEYLDAEVSGASFYRLKQMNKDGSFTYSKTVYLPASATRATMTISNNLVQQKVQVSVFADKAGHCDITLYAIDGRQILKKHWLLRNGQNQVELDVNFLSLGMYIISIPGIGVSTFIK